VQKKKRYIVNLLLFVNMLVLMAAVIPHHHHEGIVCLKQDITQDDPQDATTHHHPQDDACCNNGCLTHLFSSTLAAHTDTTPIPVLILTLFTSYIIGHLLRPRERHVKPYYIYRETLHGIEKQRSVPLRAPPVQ
jgi:hypothetical protein